MAKAPITNPRSYLSPDDLLEIASAFQRSRTLLTAFELGLFTALGEEPRSSTEVARRLKTDPRATDRLMNALCAMKLLCKEEGVFFNTPLTSKFLISGRSGYMTGLAHWINLWESWGTLTAAVRAGTSTMPTGIDQRDSSWCQAFIAAMHYRALWQAPTVIPLIDCSSVRRLLDIGGGSGVYSIAFAKMKDGLRATVFDLPAIVPLTKAYIHEEGFEGKVDTVPGDYLTDDLGHGYDLAFLSAILHSNTPEQNRMLLTKAAAAVDPGGQVVVQDFIMDEDRTSPPFGAFFALNMLVATQGGDTYTEAEVRGWMQEAGLIAIERKDTAFGTTLMIGQKPQGETTP